MRPKFWPSLIIVFVVNMMLSFLEHGVLLNSDYSRLIGVIRSEQESQAYFPWLLLGQLLLSTAFVWIYQQGRENKNWVGQGLGFGLAAALISTVPHHLIYHAVAQFPASLVMKQIVLDIPVMLCLGLVVAWMNR